MSRLDEARSNFALRRRPDETLWRGWSQMRCRDGYEKNGNFSRIGVNSQAAGVNKIGWRSNGMQANHVPKGSIVGSGRDSRKKDKPSLNSGVQKRKKRPESDMYWPRISGKAQSEPMGGAL